MATGQAAHCLISREIINIDAFRNSGTTGFAGGGKPGFDLSGVKVLALHDVGV
jgi:hypothetical protein